MVGVWPSEEGPTGPATFSPRSGEARPGGRLQNVDVRLTEGRLSMSASSGPLRPRLAGADSTGSGLGSSEGKFWQPLQNLGSYVPWQVFGRDGGSFGGRGGEGRKTGLTHGARKSPDLTTKKSSPGNTCKNTKGPVCWKFGLLERSRGAPVFT